MINSFLQNFLLCWIILGSCFAHAQGNYQGVFPSIQHETVDLATYPIASLYRGEQKVFVADSLDVVGIYQLVRQEKGIWHLELGFQSPLSMQDSADRWLQLRSSVNAAEVSLNDHLLLKNGIVGNTTTSEIAGKSLIRKRIPQSILQEGMNKLSITFSNFKHQEGAIFKDLSIGTFQSFQKQSAIMSTAPLLLSGIFLFAVFINIALYFSLNRKTIFLVLVGIFSMEFLLMSHETFYWQGFLAPNFFVLDSLLRDWLEYIPYFLLSYTVVLESKLKTSHLVIATACSFTVYLICSLTNMSIGFALSLVPLILSFITSIQYKTGTWLTTTTLSILSLFIFIDHYDLLEGWKIIHQNIILTSFIFKLDVIGMVFFSLIMVFTSAKSILEQTQSLHETQFKLERLEHQFLQKLIQPHFLMNSLMSLQQLVNNSPKEATQMLEALAEVFHLFIHISKQKLIPLHQEIEICQAHLQLMGMQQRANYFLETKGLIGHETIPPAVFLTLVENGITHGYSGNQDAFFKLSKTESPLGIKYRLFNNSNAKNTDSPSTSGTGLKYVEARLEECYPQKWVLLSRPIEGGWEVIIELNKKA